MEFYLLLLIFAIIFFLIGRFSNRKLKLPKQKEEIDLKSLYWQVDKKNDELYWHLFVEKNVEEAKKRCISIVNDVIKIFNKLKEEEKDE